MTNMEYPEGEKLLGGTPLYTPPSKDELVAKADKMLTYVGPLTTLAHPVAGVVLQVAKGKTSEILAEKKDKALEKKHEALTKSISEIKEDTAKITKAVSEVKQEIQDIRDKPISKQIIKNDTRVNVVKAINFITIKDDSKDDFRERQQNFSNIQNSFSQLSTIAMLNNCNELAQVLNVSNNLVGIAKAFETLQMASTLGTLSIESFASGLGMVTSVLTLCQSIFGEKDNGIGLADMIIDGFQHVMESINALRERMDYRFDRIEHLMERHHYQTITMLFELSRQTNGLHNLIMQSQEIQRKQVHSIRYDISQVSLNLRSCSAMIQNNINAFREEKLIDILREIDYYIENNIITIDQVHQYFAKLMACFETVAMNSNLTGRTLLSPSSSTDIQIKALQDALATNLYSVVNVFTDPTIVGHLEILEVLDIYTRQLISIIPTPTEYHREFSARITAEIDKFKTVTFSNPFPTTDAEVLVTENWTHEKNKMHSKVNQWFSNEVAIVLEKIRNETANDFRDDNYISIKLKKPNSSSAINFSDEARSLATLKALKAAGQIPFSCGADLFHLVNRAITLQEAYRLCVAFDNNDVASKDFYSWESFEYVKQFLDNKYKSNEHMFIALEFNGIPLWHIRDVSQIDMLLVQYGIYNQFEFTHRYQQYQDMGIIIKLRFCIGFDETIQIYQHLVNVISEKEEISRLNVMVIPQKYAELKDLKRFKPIFKPIDVLKDAIFGYICTDFIVLKFSIKRIDDFLVRGDMFTFRSKMFASRYSRSLVAQGIPTKVEEFKAETAEFFKLDDDNYKEAVRQNELHTIAEQVLVKLKAKQTE
jgi:hypothetical protein